MEEVGILDDAIKKGVTSAFQKVTYEVYLNNLKKSKNKTNAVIATSIEVDLSERYVWSIIKKMETWKNNIGLFTLGT